MSKIAILEKRSSEWPAWSTSSWVLFVWGYDAVWFAGTTEVPTAARLVP